MNSFEDLRDDEEVIDLLDLFIFLKKHIIQIVGVTILFAIVAGLVTTFCIDKQYASNARVFVKPAGNDSGNYNYTNIYANNYMVENYVEMLKGNNIQTQVANKLGYKVGTIKGALRIKSVEDTQIISITAVTGNPAISKQIVDETVDVFINEVKTSLGVTNISIVDEAIKSKYPVSPSLKKNVVYGAGLGLILMLGIYFFMFILDTHIHNKDEAEKYLGIPNLGSIAYKKL